jgi:hypothetical protein
MTVDSKPSDRDVVFISKATPGDDEFVLWLAPKLEAHGYKVFADILSLEPGDRWRKEITRTLQDKSARMLLCARDSTLAAEGVHEEIGIATDLAKQFSDKNFIIPLRLESFKKLFGIGEFQYVDFVRGWAQGLDKLLAALKRQHVPCNPAVPINPTWEIYRRRSAIKLQNEPERLTSNWLRVVSTPDCIRYFEPTGAFDFGALAKACESQPYPAEPKLRGLFTFATLEEVNTSFSQVARFALAKEFPLVAFIEEGAPALGIAKQEASNMVHSMFRQAWDRTCRDRGLLQYRYSKYLGFHASKDQAKIGQKFSWGRQGARRSSMLRNQAKGQVWQFGVSAIPAFSPYYHFRLKSRVLFAPPLGTDAGEAYDDPKKQHRFRRSICKGWRNKQWHGRLMAFIELLSGESSFIALPLSPSTGIRLEAAPTLFTSPVSTVLPNTLADEDEEDDDTTLGKPEPEDEP